MTNFPYFFGCLGCWIGAGFLCGFSYAMEVSHYTPVHWWVVFPVVFLSFVGGIFYERAIILGRR